MKLGIDFGTTNSTAGRVRPDGERPVSMMPSLGVWRNGEFMFGREAHEALRSGDRSVHPIRDLKLFLGTDKSLAIGTERVDPEEAAASLMRALIKPFAREEGIEQAVIGTPVHATHAHRAALRRAAMAAGIRHVDFIYEPTAALIGARRFREQNPNDLVLVVDWGGGTLDLAVVRSDGQRYEELSVGGDFARLGGTKIDEALANELINKDDKLRAAVHEIGGGFDRLKDELESMKIEILEDLEGEDGPPQKAFPAWLKVELQLDASAVFRVVREFSRLAAQQILAKLQGSGISKEEVTEVLFAGGVTNCPAVRDEVMGFFSGAREIVHSGTGRPLPRQALTGAGCAEATDRKLTIALGAPVAIRQADGSFCVVLDRGLSFEVDSYRKVNFTVTDPEAPEAVLDIGLLPGAAGYVRDILAHWNDSFDSLKQLFVPVGRFSRGSVGSVPDWLGVSVGVDRNLSVTVFAKSRMTGQLRQANLTAVPLILDLGERVPQ